jgi:hypothetical protein
MYNTQDYCIFLDFIQRLVFQKLEDTTFQICFHPQVRGIRYLYSWIFQLIYSFQPYYSHGVNSAFNREEYQESSQEKGQPVHKADSCTAICGLIV